MPDKDRVTNHWRVGLFRRWFGMNPKGEPDIRITGGLDIKVIRAGVMSDEEYAFHFMRLCPHGSPSPLWCTRCWEIRGAHDRICAMKEPGRTYVNERTGARYTPADDRDE